MTQETFEFPEDTETTEEFKDLLSKLICKQETRLGRNGIDEIKKHPWFKSIDWENIRNRNLKSNKNLHHSFQSLLVLKILVILMMKKEATLKSL